MPFCLLWSPQLWNERFFLLTTETCKILFYLFYLFFFFCVEFFCCIFFLSLSSWSSSCRSSPVKTKADCIGLVPQRFTALMVPYADIYNMFDLRAYWSSDRTLFVLLVFSCTYMLIFYLRYTDWYDGQKSVSFFFFLLSSKYISNWDCWCQDLVNELNTRYLLTFFSVIFQSAFLDLCLSWIIYVSTLFSDFVKVLN